MRERDGSVTTKILYFYTWLAVPDRPIPGRTSDRPEERGLKKPGDPCWAEPGPTVKWCGATDNPVPGPVLLEQAEQQRGRDRDPPKPWGKRRPARSRARPGRDVPGKRSGGYRDRPPWGLSPGGCHPGRRRPSGMRGRLQCPGTPAEASAPGGVGPPGMRGAGPRLATARS
ncbi:hypothetical protein NDU88_000495 [Pleurodeles waltl]|uniref:Uncharacterized protein n=1 Tax=Pleurodeles waltl TaxID=8319 RepID=A0AAV7TF68_PLEWA|nr:hypothetical protein NDU88_000495 [Pleurodeles waltl]